MDITDLLIESLAMQDVKIEKTKMLQKDSQIRALDQAESRRCLLLSMRWASLRSSQLAAESLKRPSSWSLQPCNDLPLPASGRL
jgi:hypothetical protein